MLRCLLACWGSLQNRRYIFCRLLGVPRQARSEQGAPDTGGGGWRVMPFFPHLTPSRVSGAFRSLRACLRAPEKLQKKKSACAGVQLVHAPLIQSILSNKGLLSAVVKCIFFSAVYFNLLTFFFCFCCYNCSCCFCCWVRFGPVDISKCNPKVIP